MRGLASLIVGFVVWTAEQPVLGQASNPDGERCYQATLTAESAPDGVEACTRAITSGRYAGAELAKLYANRGIKHRHAGNLQQAAIDFDIAVELDRHEWRYYEHRGITRSDAGEFESALEDCGIAIQLAPSQPYPYVCRGWAFDKLGQSEAAREDYRRALNLLPPQEPRGTRAWIATRLGEMRPQSPQ